jgi:hypothetical protein
MLTGPGFRPGGFSMSKLVLILLAFMISASHAEMEGETEVPPLVTAESIARAKELFKGSPIQFQAVRPQNTFKTSRSAKLSSQMSAPKHTTMLAEPPSAFAGIPPVVFVLTFFGSVGAIVIMFAVAERSE